MKNCIGVFGLSLQRLDCFDGGQNKQFDFAALGFELYFQHHGQSTICTTAEDELAAFPGDLLFYRERRVAELLAESLGWFFLALANFTAINDDVVLVRDAVDLEGPEGKFVETRTCPW